MADLTPQNQEPAVGIEPTTAPLKTGGVLFAFGPRAADFVAAVLEDEAKRARTISPDRNESATDGAT